MKQKKLMVLGASSAQLPMIQRAIDLGCYVITVDNIPGNIGHRYAHASINCSTVEREQVLQHAKTHAIHGIVTFASDIATGTVAYVASQLGLPGGQTEVVDWMSNKAKFRSFQQHHALTHPGFLISQHWQVSEFVAAGLNTPVIFKPIDTSGSRGVVLVEQFDAEACAKAFNYAQQFSRSGLVSIEEFATGVDISGDGFLKDGELALFITQKYMSGFVPVGHSFPTNISALDQLRIQAELQATCEKLGYRDGPIDFDVKISASEVVVIEMSARLGGNGIPELIHRASGVDLIALTIQFALAENFSLPNTLAITRACGSWVFGSDIAGVLEHVQATPAMYEQVPNLFNFTFNYAPGDQVPYFEHSGNSLGYALFDCPPPLDYQQVLAEIRQAMQLSIVPLSVTQEVNYAV